MNPMKFIHYPVNPEGVGIDKIADVYVAKDFDPNMKVDFSDAFRKAFSEAALSKDLKLLLDRTK